jgi:hypothetical protein
MIIRVTERRPSLRPESFLINFGKFDTGLTESELLRVINEFAKQVCEGEASIVILDDSHIARTTVSKDKGTGEWVVKAYNAHGKRLPNADYFTTSREDAQQTANKMVNNS